MSTMLEVTSREYPRFSAACLAPPSLADMRLSRSILIPLTTLLWRWGADTAERGRTLTRQKSWRKQIGSYAYSFLCYSNTYKHKSDLLSSGKCCMPSLPVTHQNP